MNRVRIKEILIPFYFLVFFLILPDFVLVSVLFNGLAQVN